MLQLAGLEMDIDPPLQWKRLAHEAAHYLHGSQIHRDQVPPPAPLLPPATPPHPPYLHGSQIHPDQVLPHHPPPTLPHPSLT